LYFTNGSAPVCNGVSAKKINGNGVSISVFPNPVRNNSNIIVQSLSSLKGNSITLIDILGKVITSTTINEEVNFVEISTNKLSKGVCLVKIENPNDNSVRILKLVVKF